MAILTELILRPLASLEEYKACTGLQEEVWGTGFSEKVPPAILMISNRIGGLSAGAFDPEGVLQGFVFGLTGVVEGEVVHWSDMLAVRTGVRDRSIGTRLKLYQREVLLGRGIRRVHWTFDSLQGRNAHVNFAKLGIVCREYARNLYGETDSPLHRGVGTDRLVATWLMDSERVERRLVGTGPPPTDEEVRDVPRLMAVGNRGALPEPGPVSLDLDAPRLLLPVPRDVDEMMRTDLSLAVRWRETTRQAFVHYLSRGYEIREFLRGKPVSAYLLVDGRRQEDVLDASGAGARDGLEEDSGPGGEAAEGESM